MPPQGVTSGMTVREPRETKETHLVGWVCGSASGEPLHPSRAPRSLTLAEARAGVAIRARRLAASNVSGVPSAERASRFLTAHRRAGGRRDFRRAAARPRAYVVVTKIPLTQLIAPGFVGVPVSSGTIVKKLNLIAGLS
jgi:hypothetical protein